MIIHLKFCDSVDKSADIIGGSGNTPPCIKKEANMGILAAFVIGVLMGSSGLMALALCVSSKMCEENEIRAKGKEDGTEWRE